MGSFNFGDPTSFPDQDANDLEDRNTSNKGFEETTSMAQELLTIHFKTELEKAKKEAEEADEITPEMQQRIDQLEATVQRMEQQASALGLGADSNINEYNRDAYQETLENLQEEYPNLSIEEIEQIAHDVVRDKYTSAVDPHQPIAHDPDVTSDPRLHEKLAAANDMRTDASRGNTTENAIHTIQNDQGDDGSGSQPTGNPNEDNTDPPPNGGNGNPAPNGGEEGGNDWRDREETIDDRNDDSGNSGSVDPVPDVDPDPGSGSSSTPEEDGFDDDGEWDGDEVWPIVMDLDGDGVEIEFGGLTYFDMDDDGFMEQTAWAAADDGFLTIDLNADGTIGDGDGVIDQTLELSFAMWGGDGMTDLQALAEATDAEGNKIFDTNSDGVLDDQDDHWSSFKIWQDLNQDGITDEGELKTLEEWGITSINLTYDDGSAFAATDDDITVFGNTLHGLASFVMNGETIVGGVGDVSLSYEELGWREVETETGFAIEFEGGERYDYGVIEADDAADLNLNDAYLDGATGDDRDNALDGAALTKEAVISGGAGDDTIDGGWSNDMLSGDEGADELRGNGGDDVIFFDSDDTVVDGGEGVDVAIAAEWDEFDEDGTQTVFADDVTLDLEANGFEVAYGGDGDDSLTVSSTFETTVNINGGAGDDTVTGGASDDVLSGDAGDDVITANEGDDIVIGGTDADNIQGGSGSDFISAGTGDDYAHGGTGDDFMLGGTGSDELRGAGGDDFIDGGSGKDTLYGSHGDDQLFGGDGNDKIVGGSGDDYAEGGAGNDLFIDGNGDDFQRGDAGDDVYDRSSNAGGYDVFYGGTGTDTVQLAGQQSDWTVENRGDGKIVLIGNATVGGAIVELLDVEFAIFADEPDADPLNLLGDEMDITADHSSDAELEGDHEDDVNIGSGNLDQGYGSGDDFVDAAEGGYAANDTINGNQGDDVVNAEGGDDDVLGGSGADDLYGGDGADNVHGNSGADLIIGGDGGDVLNGGAGSDFIIGDGHANSGTTHMDDTTTDASYNNFSDETNAENGGAGDTIEGGAGDDVILGGKGHDVITDSQGSDLIKGGAHNDTIDAGSGADRVYGGDGSDDITGGLGDDYLVGDAGYSEEMIVRQIGYLAAGDESFNVELSLEKMIANGASYEVLINHFLGTAAYGFELKGSGGSSNPTESGQTFSGWGAYYIKSEDLKISDGQFLEDVLPRVYGRDATEGEYAYWMAKLENGASYSDVILEIIGEGLVYSDKLNTFYTEFGEYGVNWTHHIHFNDTIDGGAGNDRAYGMQGDDLITMGEGRDEADGGSGNDTIDGGLGDDDLSGGMGDDLLIGGSGADVIEGGQGADTIIGDNEDGTGANPLDIVSYANSGESVTVDLSTQTATGGDATGDVISGIEGIIGSSFGDDLTGDASNNRVFGGAGGDVIDGGAGHDLLDGGAGSDTIEGGNGVDELQGGAGNDVLSGGAGNDLLVGGEGRDILEGGDGEDYLAGEDGNDLFVLSGTGEDTVEDFTFGEDAILLGDGVGFADLTITQDGDDALVSHGGSTLRLVNVDSAELTAANFAVSTTVATGDNAIDLSTDASCAVVQTGIGDDTITGTDYGDVINGGSGVNHLEGGSGDDIYVIDMVDNPTNASEAVDLTDVYRGQFEASQTNQHGHYHADFAIDGDGATFNHTHIGDTLEIDMGTGFDLTKIEIDNRNALPGRLTGATLNILDDNRNIIETFPITDLNDLNFDLLTSDNARFVQIVGPENNYLHVDEVKIFGHDKHAHDIITDSEGENDTIAIRGDLTRDDIHASSSDDSDDLTLFLPNGQKITIEGQWADLDNPVIEWLELDSGEKIDLREFHEQSGDDEILAGVGETMINGYLGDDFITGSYTAATIHGHEGDDTIDGFGVGSLIDGGEGDDYIYVKSIGIAQIEGGEGIDTLDYSKVIWSVTVDLGAGTANFIYWPSAVDSINGIENVIGSYIHDVIIGSDENNHLQGAAGHDVIQGGLGNDTLDGGLHNDTYIYELGDGNDTIIDAHGNDVIEFGPGITNSMISYEVSGDDLLIYVTDGEDISTITIVDHTNNPIEQVILDDGTTHAISGKENPGDPESDDLVINLGGGADIVNAGAGNDTITTNNGSDVITAGGGRNVIDGGNGKDTYIMSVAEAGSSSEVVDLTEMYRGLFQAAHDTEFTFLYASNAIDGLTSSQSSSLLGGVLEIDLKLSFDLTSLQLDIANNTAYPLEGAKIVILDANRNVLEEITLGAEDDPFVVLQNASDARYVQIDALDDQFVYLNDLQIFGATPASYDMITDASGNDTIRIEGVEALTDIAAVIDGNNLKLIYGYGQVIEIIDQFADAANPTIETLELDGGVMIDLTDFDNLIFGSLGSVDSLGLEGNNEITGGSLDDIIEGHGGDDILTGGMGADTFVFEDGDGKDTITDFNLNEDMIDLVALGITYADLEFENTDGDGLLITYSENGNGEVTGQILLDNIHSSEITEDHFVF
ncbi:MAG: hypothetical protein AAF429_04965 [Pseudomonadota bacterium]